MAVINLQQLTPDSSTIDLTWALPSVNLASSLTVEQSTDGGNTWVDVATLAPTQTSYTAADLSDTSMYSFQVEANDSFGFTNSPWTTPLQPGTPAPPVPTGLTGSFHDDTYSMQLSWTASAGAVSYVIDRETVSTGVWSNNFATSTNAQFLDSNYMQFSVSSINTRGGYHYRVRAVSSGYGVSPPSNEFPQSAYAVIDLGVVPDGEATESLKLSNTGLVLLGMYGAFGPSPSRWVNGTIQPLNSGDSNQTFDCYDIDDQGDVIGMTYGPNNIYGTACVWPSYSATPVALIDDQTLGPARGSVEAGFDEILDPNGNIYGVFAQNSGHGPPSSKEVGSPYYSYGGAVKWNNYLSSDELVGSITANDPYPISGNDYYYQTGTQTLIRAANNGHLIETLTDFDNNTVETTVDGISCWGASALNSAGDALVVDVDSNFNIENTLFSHRSTSTITLPNCSHMGVGTLNSAFINQQPCPQILGYDGAEFLIQKDPTTNTYHASNLNDILPTGGGWSSLIVDDYNYSKAINDSGAIVGTATYSGTNTAIASGSHGVMLCPCSVVNDPNNTYTVDMTNPVLPYVRFGLWDNAFDNSTPPNVLNGNAESANFVGSDSRRFYIRVYDPSATTTTVTADWYTKKSDGTNDDHPSTDTITLTRSSTNPAVYVSKALLLVTDEVDNAQVTNTGLSGGGNAAEGAADHRLRRAALGDTMCYAYTPAAANQTKSTFTEPIFNPSSDPTQPDTIKNINIQIVNTQGGIGNIPAASTTFINSLSAVVTQRYAIAGIKAHVSYNYSNDILSIPVPTNTPPTGITLDAFNNGSAGTTGGDEQVVLQMLRSKYGAYTTGNNTFYLILIQEFTSTGLRGESYVDGGLTPAVLVANPLYTNAIHCCFVAQTCDTPSIMAPPHEIGHQLLNRVPADLVGNNNGHYVGILALLNLMFGGGTNGTGVVTDSKRLWDDPVHTDGVHQYQIDYMRQSPFLY